MDTINIKRYGQTHKNFPEPLLTETGNRYFLDEAGTALLDIFFSRVADTADFDELWNLHPEEKGKIKIADKEIDVPRYQQSYGKEYWFSGMTHESLPIPDILLPFLEEANNSQYGKLYGATGFNEILVNWYADGNHYIRAHSDDESEMVTSINGENVVYSLTLQEAPGNRIFRLKPKLPPKSTVSVDERKSIGKERIDLELQHKIVAVMAGTCQKKFKHQVPKTKKTVGRRINITFRCFRE